MKRLLFSLYHVLLILWTFLGAFILPKIILPFWIFQIGLTFLGWIVFKGKCWVTRAELGAAPVKDERYQSSTLRLIAKTGVDVARHKAPITLVIDSWHYLCVIVAFYRLGHVEYAAVFLAVWFVVNRGYRNVWNY
jgi:hypothetical protein